MPKVPTVTEKSKALDVLTSIAEEALDFRYQDRAPNLVDIGRTVLAGSRMLRFRDRNERTDCENQAVMAIAKRQQLVS
jgi:hypothetical protein